MLILILTSEIRTTSLQGIKLLPHSVLCSEVPLCKHWQGANIYIHESRSYQQLPIMYVQTCVLCGEVAPGAFPPHGGVGKRSETAEYLVKVSAIVFVFCKQTAALVNRLPYLLQYPPCFSFSEYEFLITRRLATFRIYCRRKECEKAVYRIM